MDVTNEVIRRVVQNAAILVQMQNMGVSNKAELRHLMTLFAGAGSIEDAHRLSALVFGAQQCRHFTVNAERETERIAGRQIDAAFLPLDDRQEEYFYKGMDWYLRSCRIRYAFPMHYWQDASVIRRFEKLENGIIQQKFN